jgi:flagellar hook-length control protein FliK
MNDTHIFDMSAVDSRDSFEAPGAKKPSVEGDFQRELLNSLMLQLPEVERTPKVSLGADVEGQVSEKVSKSLPAESESERARAADGELPKDHAKALKDAVDSKETKEARGARAKEVAGERKVQEDAQEKTETKEVKENSKEARDSTKVRENSGSALKGTEKFELASESAKESIVKGQKAEVNSEPLENTKPEGAKASSEKSSQKNPGGDTSNTKANVTISKDAMSEAEGESLVKAALKESASISKASLQAQIKNNATGGALNSNGSENAPQVKLDATSLGASSTQSSTAPTTTAAVKSSAPARSTAFDNVLLRQVSTKMAVTFKNNVGKALLSLNPPDLGKLRVEIIMEQSQVKATIATENVLVRDALEANLPALREALQAQGLNADDLNITLDNSQTGGEAGKWSESAKRGAKLGENNGERVEENLAVTQSIGSDSLDIFI